MATFRGGSYKDLEEAYRLALCGANEPDILVASGKMILKCRPDLSGTIDPAKAYYVTATDIVEIEDESE